MGYQRKTLKLVFEDKPDLVVYVRSVNVRRVLHLMQLADTLSGGQFANLTEAQKVIDELFGAFAERVTSWTLEDDDGEPLPVSLDSLLDWDFDEALEMVLAWIQKATSVTVPTAPGTATGPDPVEMTIPMASAGGT